MKNHIFIKGLIFLIVTIMFMSGCNNKNFNGQIEKGNQTINVEDNIKDKGVTALFIKNSNDLIYKVIVTGETNYSEYGTDIVASAISALTINTVNSLVEFTDSELSYNQETRNGLPSIELEVSSFGSEVGKEKSLVLIESLRLGLKQIEQEYGNEFLKVMEISDR
ncbi:ribosomal-processing cysteine protease Prp [Oceanobacillus salinisoli]|uniref:ribosomal-processing cysteine protease Prp n=1 Tax=Oceanobacillus salinisoli TaxID=2678611 RepID=UPI0012E0D185|nr:ribosomal-processing cysteine protease Prp [Oceanobacillus salinisoli]